MPSAHRRRAPTFARWARTASALTIRNCWFSVSNRICVTARTNRRWCAVSSPRTALVRLAPAAMQPQPLLGMLAHPAFDHRRDRLHGAADVDLPSASRGGSIASVISTRKLLPSGLRTTRSAVDRAFDLPREHRDQRIGTAAPAEENHFDALGHVLVDQHADMRAAPAAAARASPARRGRSAISSPISGARSLTMSR